MNVITLDLETRPDPALANEPRWLEHLQDKIEPDARLKDPIKVEADKQLKLAKAMERMALSPLTGLIVVIAFETWNDDHVTVLQADEATREGERRLLTKFRDCWPSDPAQLVTWHGKRFDIPFMAARCMLQGLPLGWWPKPRDYRLTVDIADDLGIDGTMSEWQFAMGGAFKEFEGDQLAELTLEQLATHCREDLTQLAIMAERTQFIWRSRQ